MPGFFSMLFMAMIIMVVVFFIRMIFVAMVVMFFVCVFFVAVVVMLFVCVFFMVVIIMLFICMIVMMLFAMVVMIIFGFQFGFRLGYSAGCGFWQYEQIKRRTKCGYGSIDRGKISVAFGSIFKADDICAWCFESHCNGCAFNRDVQCSDAMFMRIQLTRVLSDGRHGRNESNKRERIFHDVSSVC